GREAKVLSVNRLDEGCMASPAVAGKALYVRTKTHLYRIEQGAVLPKQESPVRSEPARLSDEQTLKDSHIVIDGKTLVDFLRQRIAAASESNIASLVQRLGDSSFRQRASAAAELEAVGMPAATALRRTSKDTDPERARSAADCLRRIQGGRAASLATAVVRQVRVHRPIGATEALLHYLHVSYDEYVAEEVRQSLIALAKSPGEPEQVLLQALDSPSALQRAVAGEAL